MRQPNCSPARRFMRECESCESSSPDHDGDYTKLLASKLAAGSGTVALLASTQQEPASVVFARSAELKFSCGELMKSALAEIGLRGGGSPTMAQGQVPRDALDALFDRLEADARGSMRSQRLICRPPAAFSFPANAAKLKSVSRLMWGCSSAGRAPRSQRGGQRFDPAQLHHKINNLRHTSISSAILCRCLCRNPPLCRFESPV